MTQHLSIQNCPALGNDGADGVGLGKLTNSLGFLLRMAQIEIFESFHAALGEHGLKPGEFSVLWLISQHPGVRQGVIAKSLRIKLAHMTKLIRTLEERGYVQRHIPDDDRRSVLLTLTKQGADFVRKNQSDFFGYTFSEGGNLTKVEVASLVGLLQKFTGIKAEKSNEF